MMSHLAVKNPREKRNLWVSTMYFTKHKRNHTHPRIKYPEFGGHMLALKIHNPQALICLCINGKVELYCSGEGFMHTSGTP